MDGGHTRTNHCRFFGACKAISLLLQPNNIQIILIFLWVFDMSISL